MKFRISVFVPLLLLLFSCNKQSSSYHQEDAKPLPSILSYIKALTKPTDGGFSISSSCPMNANSPGLDFSGIFVDKNTKPQNVGTIKINDISFSADAHNQYGKGVVLNKNIYGTTVRYSIEGNNTVNSVSPVYDSTYVPLEIIFSNLNLNVEYEKNIINPGKVFTVNVDNNNANGIIAVLEYNPELSANAPIKSSSPNYIRNGKVVNENGTVVLDDTYFAGIPHGAYVTITIARVNYQFIQDSAGTGTYSVHAYNYKYFDFKYQ